MRVRTLHWLRKTTPVQRIAMLVGISVLLVFVVAMASGPKDDTDPIKAIIGNVPKPAVALKPRMAPDSPPRALLDSRMELPVITVVPKQKMANLREFVGSVHRSCPGCPVVVYGFELTPEQTAEISKWRYVHVNDVRHDLLAEVGVDRSFNVVQMAIVHALQVRQRVLYLSVDSLVTGSLHSLDLTLQEKGYLFITPSIGAKDDLAIREGLVLKTVQGFTKTSAAYAEIALPLSEYPCSHLTSGPCLTSDLIRLPEGTGTRFPSVPLSSVPIETQRLAESVAKMRFQSDANTNADQNNIALVSKPMHSELETFANSHYAFIRFDLNAIQGMVKSAILTLHPLWLQNPANPSVPPIGDAAISLVMEGEWDERGIKWDALPEFSDDVVAFRVETGVPCVIDVTGFVHTALGEAIFFKKPKVISFMIRSKTDIWIKYHSRFSKKKNLHPALNVVVTGQGSHARYIKSAAITPQEEQNTANSLVEIEYEN